MEFLQGTLPMMKKCLSENRVLLLLYPSECGLGQFMRLYYGQGQGKNLLRCLCITANF